MELFKSFVMALGIVGAVLGLGALLVTYKAATPIFCVGALILILAVCIHRERGF